MNKKDNRKSKMTRKIFQETMLELLQTNHITEISVKRLCEEADLNRSTFYAHYENQMDILRDIEDETYKEVESFIMSGVHPDRKTDSKRIFEQLLQYIMDNAKVFQVLLGQNGSEDFQQKLIELTKAANHYLGVDPQLISNQKVQYARIYRVAGCTKVIENWIQQGFDQSVEELAQLLIHLNAE